MKKGICLGMALTALAMLAACGGSGDDATPPVSPTAAPTQLPPRANDPLVPLNTTEIGSGNIQINVAPDEPTLVDPLQLAEVDGVAAPACGGFIFASSWLVVSPYPPGDVQLEVSARRQGSSTVVGASPSGGATTGCDVLEFENLSDVPLLIDLRYVIAGQ
jgi:hypothetical protein